MRVDVNKSYKPIKLDHNTYMSVVDQQELMYLCMTSIGVNTWREHCYLSSKTLLNDFPSTSSIYAINNIIMRNNMGS